MSQMPDTFDGIIKEVPKSVSEIEKLPLHLLLIILGGGLAILLGIIMGIIELALTAISITWLGNAVMHLIVCLIIGPLLIISFVICKRDLFFGSVLAGLFSVILIFGGGVAGLIGGLLGLFGALFTFFKSLDETKQATRPTPASAPPMQQPTTVQPQYHPAPQQAPPPTQPVPVTQTVPSTPPSQPSVGFSSKPGEPTVPPPPAPTPPPTTPTPQPEPTQPQPVTQKATEKIVADEQKPTYKFCIHCGTKIPTVSTFCSSCGGKIV